MYVTKRAIGAMDALPSCQLSKLRGRKTARRDGQVQIRRVGNSITKLVKWSMLIGKNVMAVQEMWKMESPCLLQARKRALRQCKLPRPTRNKVTTAFPSIVYNCTAVQHTFTSSNLIC